MMIFLIAYAVIGLGFTVYMLFRNCYLSAAIIGGLTWPMLFALIMHDLIDSWKRRWMK